MSFPKIRRILFTLLLTLLVASAVTQSQDRRLLIVSPSVGTEVDSLERATYELFPAVKEFQSATFYRLPDSTFWVWLLLKSPEGNLRDSAYEIGPGALNQIAERIERRNRVNVGVSPTEVLLAHIRYADGSDVIFPSASTSETSRTRSKDILSLRGASDVGSRPLFQTIHVDLSVGYGSAAFMDLRSLTGSTSNSFVPVSFGIDIPFQEEDGLALRGAWSFALGGAGEGSLFSYAITLSYTASTDISLKPIFGVGYGHSSYSYSSGTNGGIELSASQPYPLIVLGTSLVHKRLDLMVSIPLAPRLTTSFEESQYTVKVAGVTASFVLSL